MSKLWKSAFLTVVGVACGLDGSAMGQDASVASHTLRDGRTLTFTMPLASNGTRRETLGFDELEDGTLVQYVLVSSAVGESVDALEYQFDAEGRLAMPDGSRDVPGTQHAPPCNEQGPPYCWSVDEPPTYEIDPQTGRTLKCVLYYTVCQDPCGNITTSDYRQECTPLRRPRTRNPQPPLDVASASTM